MKKDKNRKDIRRASFTVEAAMLMGIVLFVILSSLYTAQTVYNKTLLLADAYEEAITKREKEVNTFWGTEDADISIEIEELEPVSFLWRSQWAKRGGS